MPPRAKLTLSEIEALKNQGLNQSEIAEMYDMTRQAVSWVKQTYGGTLTPRERILRDHFPWKVPAEFATGPYRLMRDHAEYFATGGKGMPDKKLSRLRGLYRRLRAKNAVVEFDPNIAPNSFSRKGGWALVDRMPSDGDLLIRVNDYTNLTTEGEIIWELPEGEP